MTDNTPSEAAKAIAETLCTERCAQAGDPPCSRVSSEPHCDECLGMAAAVIDRHLPAAEPVACEHEAWTEQHKARSCCDCDAELPDATPPDKVNSEALADLIAMDADLIDQTSELVDVFMRECTQLTHDMAHHVGDEIFELLKRHGLLMLSEAGATAMMALAARQVLAQAIDQCSRAAEVDCTAEVMQLFLALLEEPQRAALFRAKGEAA